MESNGKHVNIFGENVDYPVGEIDFGEPGYCAAPNNDFVCLYIRTI